MQWYQVWYQWKDIDFRFCKTNNGTAQVITHLKQELTLNKSLTTKIWKDHLLIRKFWVNGCKSLNTFELVDNFDSEVQTNTFLHSSDHSFDNDCRIIRHHSNPLQKSNWSKKGRQTLLPSTRFFLFKTWTSNLINGLFTGGIAVDCWKSTPS